MSKQVNEAWADYLRKAMKAAGYEPDGARSGGRTRLAEDAGISLPVISRTLNEGRTPDPATLRSMAGPLGISYRELLIAAGHATEEELPGPEAPIAPVTPSGDALEEELDQIVFRLDVPPDATPQQRAMALRAARASARAVLAELDAEE